MQAWLIAPLILAAILLAAWWAETKATIVITELRAIRENLDRLWSSTTEETGGDGVETKAWQQPVADGQVKSPKSSGSVP